MNSIYPFNEEQVSEPRRPWSYWAQHQAYTLRAALGCDDQEWEELERRTMKEKPILFSGPMVRAILEGRKTQTRRVIKPPPIMLTEETPVFSYREKEGINSRCPYGPIGRRLYVRETWGLDPDCEVPYYKATEEHLEIFPKGYWRPSIHMPRWASRITLEVTGIWVERVQEITEKDARAEGVSPFTKSPWDAGDCWTDGKYRTAFEYEWNEIFGWSPNAWARNDRVWVLEFKRVKP